MPHENFCDVMDGLSCTCGHAEAMKFQEELGRYQERRADALKLVLWAAEEWAGEYGFAMPEVAKEVFKAISLLETGQ